MRRQRTGGSAALMDAPSKAARRKGPQLAAEPGERNPARGDPASRDKSKGFWDGSRSRSAIRGAQTRRPPNGAWASATAAEPPLADGVTGLLALPEELLVCHHRQARMIGPPMRDVSFVIRHADHQTGGLCDHLADVPGTGDQHFPYSAATATPPISTAVLFTLRNALRASMTP